MVLLSSPVYAASAIVDANNQASVNLLFQHQKLFFYNNPSAYNLYNMNGNAWGTDFAFTKTFHQVYTHLDLSFSNAALSYNNPFYAFSKATHFVQQIRGRLGYSFFPREVLGLTPYLGLGYQLDQLDTGGAPDPVGYYAGGSTQVFRSVQYGAGLLGQWAATPAWVLSADFMLFNLSHPWVDLHNATYDTQATLGNQFSWQLAINSDYKITPKIHAQMGVQYAQSGYSGAPAQGDNIFPGEKNHTWQLNAGLGYAMDTDPIMLSVWDHGYKPELMAANNQAVLRLGYLWMNYGEFNPGQAEYYDREYGELPQLSIEIAKTWKHIFGQLALSEAMGDLSYSAGLKSGALLRFSSRTVITEVWGRLGYQFFFLPSVSLTPYVISGYHRWLRTLAYIETYHNDWFGLGGMLQWSPISNLVISLDSNVGNTFNSQNHSWDYVGAADNSVLIKANMSSRSYLMASVGGDYTFAKVWHALAGVKYWRFNYGLSPKEIFPNGAYIYEPSSNTRQFTVSLGLGYTLL